MIKPIWDEIKSMFVGLFYYALFLIILGFALFGGCMLLYLVYSILIPMSPATNAMTLFTPLQTSVRLRSLSISSLLSETFAFNPAVTIQWSVIFERRSLISERIPFISLEMCFSVDCISPSSLLPLLSSMLFHNVI